MFTQPAFIRKNTPELRKELEKLGYFPYSNVDRACLYTFWHPNLKGCYNGFADYILDPPNICSFTPPTINCRDNIPLFLAIAALRDDNDYMQWFTDGNIWTKCSYNEFHFIGVNPENVSERCDLKNKFHKASVKELIEYF